MPHEENHTNSNNAANAFEARENELLNNKASGEELYHFYNSWGNNLYNIAKDFVAAEQQYRRAIHHFPDAYISYANLGLALQKQNRPAEAIDAFKRSVEIAARLNQKNDAAWEYLCIERGNQGDWQSSEQDLLKNNVSPENLSRFYNAWGNHLHNVAANYKAAAEKYRKAIQYNPESVVDYKNLGLALQMQNKSQEAVEAFKKSIAIAETREEKNDSAREYLAIEKGKVGNWESEEKELLQSNVAGNNLSRFYNAWGNWLYIETRD